MTLEIARVGEGAPDLVQSLRERAGVGSIDAMIAVATLLQVGVGAVKDDAEAVRWYKKAPDLGNVDAMTFLGAIYLEGAGVSKDQAEAQRWFRKGAEAGDAAAMTKLAYGANLNVGVD